VLNERQTARWQLLDDVTYLKGSNGLLVRKQHTPLAVYRNCAVVDLFQQCGECSLTRCASAEAVGDLKRPSEMGPNAAEYLSRTWLQMGLVIWDGVAQARQPAAPAEQRYDGPVCEVSAGLEPFVIELLPIQPCSRNQL